MEVESNAGASAVKRVTPNTEAAIFARVIESGSIKVTPEIARYLLSMQLPENDRNRVDVLSGKARDGCLTPEEEAELDSYLHVGNLLGIIQSRVRRILYETGH